MASPRKLLAQACPTTTNEDPFYKVPQGKETTIASLFISNNGAATTFSVRLALAIDTDKAAANRQYLYSVTPISANDTIQVAGGLTMSSGDALYVTSGVASRVAFQLFGRED